jgi:hypothetical protein
MNKKIFFVGMLAIALISGMTLVGCKQDAEANPFVGTWSGTVNISNQTIPSATLVCTETTWTVTQMSSHGTYTHSGNTARLAVDNDTVTGDGTITGSALSLTMTNGATGSFTKQ